MTRRFALFLAAATLALVSLGPASAAAGPVASGNGSIHSTGAAVDFATVFDGAQEPYFELWDYTSGQTRDIILTQVTEITCLGELFGGQAVSVSGYGWDSATNQGGLAVQVFLVDGGSGPDRLSVKLRRADERVVYFLPMRDVESGDITVSCAP